MKRLALALMIAMGLAVQAQAAQTVTIAPSGTVSIPSGAGKQFTCSYSGGSAAGKTLHLRNVTRNFSLAAWNITSTSTSSSRSTTVYMGSNNLKSGEKLQCQLRNPMVNGQLGSILAQSTQTTCNAGSIPPPTGGNAADIISWTTYHPEGWPSEIRLGYSYTAAGADRTEDAVVLTHRSAAVNHIIFSNNTQGRSADTYSYFRVDQVVTFSPWPRHDDYVIRYLHIPAATKYDPATWGILDEVWVGTLPACCSTGQ